MPVPYDKLHRTPQARAGTNNATLRMVSSSEATVDIPKLQALSSVPLWIWEMEADFSMTGSFGQSASKRDFYPRNFNQPSYTFRGQTHNEHEYGHVGEFIRAGQLQTIFGDQLFVIDLPAAGAATTPITISWSRKRKKNVRRTIDRNLKGRRPGIRLMGYIANIARAHERWVPAPEYEFAFIVSRSLAGPIKDEAVKPHVLPTNWDQFVARGGAGLIKDPDPGFGTPEDNDTAPNSDTEEDTNSDWQD